MPQSDDETRQIVAFRLERDRSLDRAVELAEQLASANAEFRPSQLATWRLRSPPVDVVAARADAPTWNAPSPCSPMPR